MLIIQKALSREGKEKFKNTKKDRDKFEKGLTFWRNTEFKEGHLEQKFK